MVIKLKEIMDQHGFEPTREGKVIMRGRACSCHSLLYKE
jgi:hypothetical protein